MKKNILLTLCIMFIYFVIDVGYQIGIGLRIMPLVYEKAGISHVMTGQIQPIPAMTIPLFFIMISIVLLILAVKPALEKKSVKFAVGASALVGIAAYGTTALVFFWSIKGYPVAAVLEVTAEGLLFPTVSSGLTTWLFLRKEKRNK